VCDSLDGAISGLHELVQVGTIDAMVLKFGDMPEVDNNLVARGRRGREGGMGEVGDAAATSLLRHDSTSKHKLRRKGGGGGKYQLSLPAASAH